MALTIHKQPSDIVLAGNPVAVNVSSDTVTQSDHKIHVRIIFSSEILAEDALPVVNNFANFDISDYLKKLESLPLTVFGLFFTTIQSAGEILNTFQAEVFETYNGDGIEHNKLSIPVFTVMQGGFSTIFLNNYLASNRNFYDNYLTEDKKYLTWQPEKRLVWNQHDFLFFIPIFIGKQNIYGRFTLYYSDATTTVIDTDVLFAGGKSPYYLNTSILAHSLLSGETPTKKLVKYEVVINDAANDPLTEIRTYYVDKTYYNQQRQFIYKNSFGVYDQLMLKGISESSDEIQRTVGFFQDQDFISDSEFTESYNANSGFLTTQYKNARTAKKYVAELVNSREIYEILGAELIPVVPTSKKVNIIKDDEFLYSFPFEYKYAYSDEFFAPVDDKQYFNPIITYRNGVVSNAIQGQTAVLDFEARLNADANISFEINWGPDIGITNINTNLVDGVWKPLQTSILIPDNATLSQQIEITDSIGGRLLLDYTITEAIVVDVDMSILVQQGYTLAFASGGLNAGWGDGTANTTFTTDIELTHDYGSTGNYKVSIYGDLLNITKFKAANNRITFIQGLKTGLLVEFQIFNNLFVGNLDMSLAPVSLTFLAHNNPGITGITFASAGNDKLDGFQCNNCNISSLDFSNVPISGFFFAHTNPNLTSITFATSGNTKVSDFRVNACDLSSLDLTNVPIGGTFWTFTNTSLTSITFATSGNTVLSNVLINNCNLSSLDFSNVPIQTLFQAQLNSSLSNITFSTTGNAIVTAFDVKGCNLTSLDLTNVPVGTSFKIFDNSSLSTLALSAVNNGTLTDFLMSDCSLANVDFSVFPTSNGVSIDSDDNSFSSTEHDNQLINLNATGWINGTLNITTGNTARTAASDAAHANLLVNGWTIN